jgi:hypothetical protein
MRISMMSKMLLAALASASMMSLVHAAAATRADGDQGPPTGPPIHAVLTSPPNVSPPTHPTIPLWSRSLIEREVYGPARAISMTRTAPLWRQCDFRSTRCQGLESAFHGFTIKRAEPRLQPIESTLD